MSSRAGLIVMAALAMVSAVTAGCGSLELPEPPDLQPLSDQYAKPSARLTQDNAAELIQSYRDAIERLDSVARFEPFVQTVVDFDRTVEPNENSESGIVIDGVPIESDALIEIEGDCPGWGTGDSAGGFEATAIIESTILEPVVWGQIRRCQIELNQASNAISGQVSYSSAISVYVPHILDLNKADQPIELLAWYDISEFAFNGKARNPWSGSFRIDGTQYEILIDIATQGHVIAFETDSFEQVGVRARNGTWICNTNEALCGAQNSLQQSFVY